MVLNLLLHLIVILHRVNFKDNQFPLWSTKIQKNESRTK